MDLLIEGMLVLPGHHAISAEGHLKQPPVWIVLGLMCWCCQEMGENLEVVREVWGMHLAATRNRIIRINLLVTVGAFALTACIVPASFFGMNLNHGLEVCPNYLYQEVGLKRGSYAEWCAGDQSMDLKTLPG